MTYSIIAMAAAVMLWTRYVIVYLEEKNRMMVLSMKEIETDLAENGRIAVERFKEHEAWYYDAILMDMRMPLMKTLKEACRPGSTRI